MRLRGGSSIHEVLAKYSAMVYRLAYARTDNHSDAENISQEVFLSLARRNPDFRTEEDRKAWLIRATVNRANSLWRTAWRKRVELRAEMEDGSAGADDASELREALSALSGDDRMLICLHYYEGYSFDPYCQPSSNPQKELAAGCRRYGSSSHMSSRQACGGQQIAAPAASLDSILFHGMTPLDAEL